MNPGSMLTIWPHVATLALLAVLGVYSWRQRSVPAARNLAVACLFAGLWVADAAGERMAADLSTKLLWFKFQALWQLPTNTAMTCFVLEYVAPGRWLTRRNLSLLSIPPLLSFVAILTNDLHHWLWTGFLFDGAIVPLRGPLFYVLFAYSLVLLFVNVIALVWLFIRSPQHRWPVGLILVAHVAGRAVHTLDLFGRQGALRWDPFLAAFVLGYGAYSIALFGFRILDPLPAARRAAIEQMRDGLVVLDTGRRVLSLNPAAEAMLGKRTAQARGRSLPELVPSLAAAAPSLAPGQSLEMDLTTSGAPRRYVLDLSPLHDARGVLVGYLLLLRDVTEQRRAQAQIVERQRALAMLQEREWLARELHDSTGQALGATSLKVGAARKLIADGKLKKADDQLARLESIVAAAHADVREYILNLRVTPAEDRPFLPALRLYLDGFGQNYDIPVELSVGAGIDEGVFAPEARIQLFRIVQEALSNVRKHAQTSWVRLSFVIQGGLLCMRIEDNGQGFDLQQAAGADGTHFGLQFMRERAEQLGGTLQVQSTPGKGTCVEVEVPLYKQ